MILACSLHVSGCRSVNRIFHRAGEIPSSPAAPRSLVKLASYRPDFSTTLSFQTPPAETKTPAGSQPATTSEPETTTKKNPQSKNAEDQKPGTATVGQPVMPATAEKYTGQFLFVQLLAGPLFAVTATTEGSERNAEVGKIMAEAGAQSMERGLFVPGLSAPQPFENGMLVSAPGGQRGLAAGLGLVSPINVFTPRRNPLTGPHGICNDLSRAGFYPDASTCGLNFPRLVGNQRSRKR